MANLDNKAFGARVKALRTELGWTQDRLASEAGISKSFLSEIEQGDSQPRGPILVKLARTLGASLDYLLEGRQPEAPVGGPVAVPAELAAMAAKRGVAFTDVQLLLRFSDLLEAHRTVGPKRKLSEQDWERYYDAVLEQMKRGTR